jgi:hypothetical protein
VLECGYRGARKYIVHLNSISSADLRKVILLQQLMMEMNDSDGGITDREYLHPEETMMIESLIKSTHEEGVV